MFGKHLKKFRVKAGLTQEQIAEKLNLSRSTVSKIESDRLEVSARLFRDWAIVTQNEFNAAMVMFGADLICTAGAMSTVIQIIIWRL